MRIWSNTHTLDGYIDDLEFTNNSEEAEVLMLGSKSINLVEFPNVKGIFRCGVGKENVPIKEAEDRGIQIGFPSRETKNIVYDETAAFTCNSIFLMVYRNIGTITPWKKISRKPINQYKLLIVGMGKIGKRVCNLMKSFLQVSTFDCLANEKDEINGLIGKADIISLHIPYTPENDSFIDKEKLSWMKNDSILINTSRGKIVSEKALYHEINLGRLFATFDVQSLSYAFDDCKH